MLKALSWQVALGTAGDEGVDGVDHVAHVELADLGEQLVGVELLEAVVFCEPPDELRVGYAGGVLHRAGAADGHYVLVGLDARPEDVPALYDVEGHRDLGRDFEGDAAELALSLGHVAVAGVEQGAVPPHGQVDRVAGAGVWDVHVAAVVARREGRARLDGGRGADGPDEGPDRDLPPAPARHVPVYLVLPDLLGQGLLQGRRQVRRGEAAEEGHEAARRPVAGEIYVLDLDGQGVAWWAGGGKGASPAPKAVGRNFGNLCVFAMASRATI